RQLKLPGLGKEIQASPQVGGVGHEQQGIRPREHDEDVTASAVDFINREGIRKRSGQTDTPFCLHVGYMLPHSPYIARKADYDQYIDVITPPKHPKPTGDESHPFFQWWRNRNRFLEIEDTDTTRARAAYWALVTAMDRMIGQLLEALERNGFEQNTMIVYSSDHGEHVGEKALWMKRTFYEESVRVPAIISWPDALPKGQVNNCVISALDLNATMLDALGTPELPHSRGRSLLPLLRGEVDTWEDIAFSEYCIYEGHYQRMIRQGDWKLIYYHGYDPQLFNLSEDPEELYNRANDEDCQAIRKELTAKVLDGWDPEWVAEKMLEKRRDLEVIREWASATNAPEQCKWPQTSQMTYLD
ncbi:MAG: sulfatase-like hydrolase/transferase, partial [Gemmatimonadota bacterium]|nr:sulfatase-like hydrolase/transferase [Gemmatimonadota bacterium]